MKLNLQKLADLERKWKTASYHDPEAGDFTTECESTTFDFMMNALHAYYLNENADEAIIEGLRPVYDELEVMGVLEGVEDTFNDLGEDDD